MRRISPQKNAAGSLLWCFLAYHVSIRIHNGDPLWTDLFILMSILSELLLAFVGCNLPQFAFSSAGHYRLLRLSSLSKMDPVN